MRIPGVENGIKTREFSIEGKDNQDEIRNPSTAEKTSLTFFGFTTVYSHKHLHFSRPRKQQYSAKQWDRVVIADSYSLHNKQ